MGSDKKIAVCHLASGDLWAGAEVQVYTLLKQLQKESDQSVSAVLLNEGELAVKLRESRVRVHVVEETKHSFSAILREIDSYLKKNRIDLIHSHRYKENILAAMIKRRGAVTKIVQTVHGEGEPFKGLNRLKAGFSTFINQFYTRRDFDQIVAVSNMLKTRLGNRFDIEKVTAIHNSIDLNTLTPKRSSDDLKQELGIKAGRPVIGTAGRLVPVKGYEVLLETARIVCDKNPDVQFVLAGDGPLKEELESKCQSLGLSDSFLFPGFRSDMVELLNMFDIMVMSSHNEGIPVILLEAMGMGKPVASTAVGGIPEVIEDKVSGLLVDSADPVQLSQALLDLLNDRELADRLAAKAKEQIIEKFTVENQAQQFISLYRDLVG